MAKVGIFFGTDTGNTRKVAKQIFNSLGAEVADKPLNINRIDADTLLSYDVLILGTPTLGEGQLPGLSSECQTESWEEFMPNFDELDLEGKKVALYGLGDQVNYPDEFVDALGELYDAVDECGAEVIGSWPTDGYTFNESQAVDEDGRFVGLVLDNDNQSDLTADRVATWLAQLESELV
ncbi:MULTISPECIES: flavodoxin [Corallincola]|uniref:Flavodoxin n=2 Tax=Corallincola TaxID=1775176 RepID=A0A368NRI8_9GAMM|nr:MULTISPECIES: flavodoxin [Corallincola]RCU52543.1 flavodoxin [Corallincola holothuriorum]TAA48264.1 flavodoxin [Corallincola spongiicola]